MKRAFIDNPSKRISLCAIFKRDRLESLMRFFILERLTGQFEHSLLHSFVVFDFFFDGFWGVHDSRLNGASPSTARLLRSHRVEGLADWQQKSATVKRPQQIHYTIGCQA